MNPHVRYWLFQIPGLVLAALVGGGLFYFERITFQTALIIFGAWVIKDIVLYPILVGAFRTDGPLTGIDKMIGLVGTVRQPLTPEGIIWVRGERWKAISSTNEPIDSGQAVKVIDADQLTLVVAAMHDGSEE